ncbi:MAG: hypothetical protein AAF402_14470, partial [Pseudomonadota bacterium]
KSLKTIKALFKSVWGTFIRTEWWGKGLFTFAKLQRPLEIATPLECLFYIFFLLRCYTIGIQN